MVKIVVYIDKNIGIEYKAFLLKNIISNKFEIIFKDGDNSVEGYLDLARKIQNKEINRVIAIDDFGTLPFNVMAKNKSIVVAQVSDFHSARMTIQHNNSNVLSLGYKIVGKENMLDIINSYLTAEFEAGRHMVRINMLENLLEGE